MLMKAVGNLLLFCLIVFGAYWIFLFGMLDAEMLSERLTGNSLDEMFMTKEEVRAWQEINTKRRLAKFDKFCRDQQIQCFVDGRKD